MYGIQGIAVYLVWGTKINQDFITNLDSKNENYKFYFDSWLSTLTQFIICVACFAAIPIFAFESRTNLHAILMSILRSHRLNSSLNNVADSVTLHQQAKNSKKYENLSAAEDVTHLNSNAGVEDGMSLSCFLFHFVVNS